jgi:hypothetical protein
LQQLRREHEALRDERESSSEHVRLSVEVRTPATVCLVCARTHCLSYVQGRDAEVRELRRTVATLETALAVERDKVRLAEEVRWAGRVAVGALGLMRGLQRERVLLETAVTSEHGAVQRAAQARLRGGE